MRLVRRDWNAYRFMSLLQAEACGKPFKKKVMEDWHLIGLLLRSSNNYHMYISICLLFSGIDYTLPYCAADTTEAEDIPVNVSSVHTKDLDSDDEPDKWLDEMGISQDVNVSAFLKA